ncbi:MAG: WD40/YVTN/BNR-like repeat-containing protein [Acidobacteriota bacterium]
MLSAGNGWTRNGPWGAGVSVLATDPNAPGTIYAASRQGVFKTTSGGLRWFRANDGLPPGEIIVESLAVDSSSPTHVYAGTYRSGLFRSLDGGASWSRLAPEVFTSTFDVHLLVIDPDDPRTLYAGFGFDALFRSSDGGESWASVSLPPGVLHSLAIAPSDSRVIFAGNFFYGNELPYAVTYCMARSTDGGLSWQGVPCSAFGGDEVLSIAVDPVNPSIAYAGSRGVYKTEDGGLTWQPSLPGSALPATRSITIDPLDPRVVYAGGAGIFRSLDRGTTWTDVGPPGVGTSSMVVSMVADRFDAETIYFAGGYGVFRSTDQGSTWTLRNTGMDEVSIVDLQVVPSDSDVLWASSLGFGIYRSHDGGQSWSRSPSAFGGAYATGADPSDPSNVYAAQGVISRSNDGGETWKLSYEACPSALTLAVDPRNPSFVYGGRYVIPAFGRFFCGGVVWSEDRGSHWNEPHDLQLVLVSSVAVHPRDESVLAGTAQGVYRSSDHGHSWRPTNLAGVEAHVVRFAPGNPAIAYAATTAGPFRSDDGGKSWSTANSALRTVALTALAIDPVDPEIVYVATVDGDVYGTRDGGRSWQPLTRRGLDASQVLALAVDTSRRLYAGTNRGVLALQIRYPRVVPFRRDPTPFGPPGADRSRPRGAPG